MTAPSRIEAAIVEHLGAEEFTAIMSQQTPVTGQSTHASHRVFDGGDKSRVRAESLTRHRWPWFSTECDP